MPVDDRDVCGNTSQPFGSKKTTKTCAQDNDLWHTPSLSILTAKSRSRRLSPSHKANVRVVNLLLKQRRRPSFLLYQWVRIVFAIMLKFRKKRVANRCVPDRRKHKRKLDTSCRRYLCSVVMGIGKNRHWGSDMDDSHYRRILLISNCIGFSLFEKYFIY